MGGYPEILNVHEPREELLQMVSVAEKNARNYLDQVSVLKPNLELLLSLGVGLLKDIILSGLETSQKKKTSPGYHGYKLDLPSLPTPRMLLSWRN